MSLIKVEINAGQFKGILDHFSNLLRHNIIKTIKNEAVPDLIGRIMDGYQDLAARAEKLPDDPTGPAYWADVFEAALHQDLEDTFSVVGNKIIFRLGNKEFLGYEPDGGQKDPHDAAPLTWMVYYLEGLLGDWAYISPDTYQKLKPGADFDPSWGRFGQMGGGFMVSKEDYEKSGWHNVIPFEQVRHPFSGYAPVDIFAEALNEWNFHPFIKKAIRATAQGRKL